MTNPTRNLTTRASLSATASHNARWFAGLLAGTATLGMAAAQQWNGTVSSSWNEPNNWTPAGVPTGNARVDTITPNYPVVTSNLLFNPNDIILGMGATATGRLDQSAGQINANAWIYVGVEGGNGTFNLTGTGSLAAPGRLWVGGSHNAGGGTGIATINTTGTLAMGSDIGVGASGGTGTLNLDAGTINSNGWTFIGKREVPAAAADNGNGTVNIDGGTWTHNGARTYIARGNSTGKLNLNGGTYSNTLGGNTNVLFAVGVQNNANASVPEVNLTGGNLNVNRLLSVGGVAVEGNDNDKNADFQGSGKGKLTIDSPNSVLAVTGEIWAGQGAGSKGDIVLNAGAINVGSWVALGRGTGEGSLTMTGGTLTKTGTGNFIVGASGKGTMVQSGGLVDIQSGLTWIGELASSTTATLTIKDTAEYRSGTISVGPRGLDATLNLDGGTVRTNRISASSEDGNGFNSGKATVNFNGTQIIATGNNAEFTRMFVAPDVLNVAAGGMKVDTNGFTLTAPMPMSGVGGVIKSGAGSLTLSGANTFSGPSSVTGGSLSLTTDSTGGGSFAVANDAVLGVTQTSPTGVLPMSGLTLENSTLSVAAASNGGNPTSAVIPVGGALALNGQTAINLVDPLPAVGPFPVISYVSKTGTGSLVAGTVPDGVVLHATTPVVDNGSVISLNIIRANAPYWTGEGGGLWNTTATNWRNTFGGALTTFANGDPVLFEDTLNTAGTYSVILSSTVTPGGSGVTFANNNSDYSLTGTASGKITGTAGLTKRGFAAATIGNLANEFTGPVLVEQGTLRVGQLTNAAVAGPLGKGNLVLAGGILDYTGPAVTIDRGFEVNATSTDVTSELILAENVTMSGPVTATNGKLRISGPGVLTLSHAGPISLANGPEGAAPATFVLDGAGLTLNGAGQTATITGNTQIAVADGATTAFTLSGDTVLNLNRFQVGFGVDSTPSVLIQGSSRINKTGAGWLSIGNSNNSQATVTVRDSGSLATEGGDFNVGDTATSKGTLLVEDNAVVTSPGAVYIGKNGTTGIVTLSEDAAMTSGNTDVAGGSGSQGTLTLQGTSSYTSGGRLLVGPGGGSAGSVVLEDDAEMLVNSYVSVGFNGGGSMVVRENATFTNTDDFSVNENGDVAATVTVQDTANMSVTRTVFVGRNATRTGILNVTGSGTLDQIDPAYSFIVAPAGTGTLNVEGTATVTVAADSGLVLTNTATGVATVNLSGGSLAIKRVTDAGGASTFNFDGGLLKAATGANADYMAGLDNAFVEDGGAKVDTNGQDIAIAQPLLAGTTAGGGLTKSGSGTLRLNGVNTYTGATTVTAGGLGGSGTIAGPLTVQSGASLVPGSATGILTANGGTTLQSGSTFVVNIDDSQPVKNGRLNTTGTLNVSGVVLQVNVTGSAGSAPYTIATATSVTGTFASVPAGVSVVYGTNSITITPPAGSPFDSWIAGFPTLTGPNAAKGADPDGDGLTNLEEFALDGNPASGTATGKVRSRIETVGGEQALVITLPVRTGATFDNNPGPGADATVAADDLVYLIQGSNDLVNFNQGVTEVTPASADAMPPLSDPAKWSYRTFRLNGVVPARGTKGFLSVTVEDAP